MAVTGESGTWLLLRIRLSCRRKCIDFHGGGQAIITENMCLEHGVVGIYAKCGQGWALTTNRITSSSLTTTCAQGISLLVLLLECLRAASTLAVST
ncbi:hypothetical protein [Enterobacter phage 02_vB_Eclo_IJM]|nr:hypothetical protein [Enterobacter phage 02_vB_Eclo_IJM]